VRRSVVSFQDAIAAADGLKRGETQVLNLASATAELREKIKDFMCGVNYTAEGSWEEIGDHVYLLAPGAVYVEVAPCSPATGQTKGFN
jgi:cell division inhibitor SepF